MLEYIDWSGTMKRLDPDYYDALELGAHLAGGVRPGPFWGYTDENDERVPFCLHGIAAYVTDRVSQTTVVVDGKASEYETIHPNGDPISKALDRLGITATVSDSTVMDLQRERGLRYGDPIPFLDVMQRIGVVRGYAFTKAPK